MLRGLQVCLAAEDDIDVASSFKRTFENFDTILKAKTYKKMMKTLR